MQKKFENLNYNVGLDIGTNSIGYAVTNMDGELVKCRGKNFWGVRLFDEGSTAESRRIFRSNRRRKQRRKQRIELLKGLFKDEIDKIDGNFFRRLQDSCRSTKEKSYPYNLFITECLNDRTFYDKYPTIYHLRYDLITSTEKADIRLIYLAIHHMIKYRGNFLYEGQSFLGDQTDISESVTKYLNFIKERYEIGFDYKDEDISSYIKYMTNNSNTKKDKLNKLVVTTDISEINKSLKEFNKAVLGDKANFSVLLMLDEKNADLVISFSDDYDEDALLALLGDDCEVYFAAKKVYSSLVLMGIRGECKYISESMKRKYEKHKKDLSVFKRLFKDEFPEYYKSFFRQNTNETNYANYISDHKNHTLEKLYISIRKILDTKKERLGDNEDYIYCINEMANHDFLKILNTKDNGAIPYQLHKMELEEILSNQGKYYDCLKDNHKKIVSLLEFRIPYYVGPLNNNSQFSWVVRKQDKIYPWNFEDVVDIEKSAEIFIQRMQNNCTYLSSEPVLPKKSLLVCEYELLDELNKVRIDGQLIPRETKEEIINSLFKVKKKVSKKSLISFYSKKGIKVNKIDGLRKEEEFAASLASYLDFSKIFDVVDHNNIDMIEEIILWITLFSDKKILRSKIMKSYPEITSDQLKKILKLEYSGWSRLSKKLLDGITVKTKKAQNITIIDILRLTNLNFMQIINSSKLGFKEIIEQYKTQKKDNELTVEDLNDIHGSPAIKKRIWQTFKLVDEIISIVGTQPINIYIEVTRNDQDKKRTESRLDNLIKIYESLSKESVFYNKQVYEELKNEKKKNSKLDNERLFLYFLQNGKCMYSGLPLNIDELDKYEVDHIMPRSLIKDDSIDNKALVIREINQRKANFLLDPEIINSRIGFWNYLHNQGLISWTKLNNLTKTVITEEEQQRFINRQLVETSQIIINVARLMHDYYKDTEVRIVKSRLLSQFRNEFRLHKIRKLNDFHHAHDAFLATIIGDFCKYRFREKSYGDYVKFGRDKKYSSGYIINTFKEMQIDENDGTVIWDPDKAINNITKSLRYKDYFISRKTEEQTGQFYDQTIYPKGKATIPLKKGLDPQLYGGYSRPTEAYSVIVEYSIDKKLVRDIVSIYVHESYMIRDDENALVDCLRKKLGVDELKILRKKILKYQSALYEGHPIYITSTKEFWNAKQLIVEENYKELIYRITENKRLDESEHDSIDKLYVYLYQKMSSEYPIYENLAKHFANAYDLFRKLELQEKRECIVQMLSITSAKSASSNFTKFKFPSLKDRPDRKNSKINLKKLEFVDMSITGVFQKRTKYGI